MFSIGCRWKIIFGKSNTEIVIILSVQLILKILSLVLILILRYLILKCLFILDPRRLLDSIVCLLLLRDSLKLNLLMIFSLFCILR